MKKAVVTGASGFIGSALCKALSSKGIETIAVVRSPQSPTAEILDLPHVKIICCEMSEYRKLHHLIPDRDVDVLFHLAWTGGSGPLRGDYQIQLRNVQYTCDILHACNAMHCKRFVFASSIMEYEIAEYMKEEVVPGIHTLYSSAKLEANYMARAVSGNLGISYIRAVISNVYGPGERSPRLINTSLRKLLKGEHCPFSPGEQLYDFLYITDAAGAFISIGQNGVSNRTYYIGSLHPRPLKDFLCEMRDQVDRAISIGLGELPFNGVSLNYEEFNIEAVKQDTGFIPSIDFPQGIKNTINWLKEEK
jgi:UDP-glucose 4-epimerase